MSIVTHILADKWRYHHRAIGMALVWFGTGGIVGSGVTIWILA